MLKPMLARFQRRTLARGRSCLQHGVKWWSVAYTLGQTERAKDGMVSARTHFKAHLSPLESVRACTSGCSCVAPGNVNEVFCKGERQWHMWHSWRACAASRLWVGLLKLVCFLWGRMGGWNQACSHFTSLLCVHSGFEQQMGHKSNHTVCASVSFGGVSGGTVCVAIDRCLMHREQDASMNQCIVMIVGLHTCTATCFQQRQSCLRRHSASSLVQTL